MPVDNNKANYNFSKNNDEKVRSINMSIRHRQRRAELERRINRSVSTRSQSLTEKFLKGLKVG